MKDYSFTEKYLLEVFKKDSTFFYGDKCHRILESGKPRPQSGECKADLYIRTKHDNGTKEFKVSIKQDNANFMENKISSERAIEIFGPEYSSIIKKSIIPIKDKFYKDKLIDFSCAGRAGEPTIKIGWKYELLNIKSGNKSGKVHLTGDQKLDIYSGRKRPDDKKNAYVNGSIIENSGVADFMLEVAAVKSREIQDYVECLKPLQDFAKEEELFFACKANNYRVYKDKWDGNRPLAVWVDWIVKGNILTGNIIFDGLLEKRSNQIGENIRKLLLDLKITKNNFDDLGKYIKKPLITNQMKTKPLT